MIRFGPAGIPLSCKGRTLRDGIEDVYNLGLNALEVQLLRTNMMERPADPEENGMTPKEIESELVIEVLREKNKKMEPISELGKPIKQGDVLISLACGVARNYNELHELGEMAKELDVQLSVHTPYYMDLVSNEEICFKSMDAIRWASIIANELGGEIVTTHIGLYGDITPRTGMKRVKTRLESLSKWLTKNKMNVKIGVENSGRQEVFGNIQEILSLSRDIKNVVPVVNFARAHAREGGNLRDPEDFQKLIEKIAPVSGGKTLYTHFSGVEHEDGNEKRLTPIKKGDLRFEPLAETVLENNLEITFISSSPLLEHDAMYMKVIFERLLAKKLSKELRSNKKGG
ncbi:MAG TPA: AP endonuclease [Euryarchaeota archaeon]|nr:AP endonuclease [Euryarchaeota archaeon]